MVYCAGTVISKTSARQVHPAKLRDTADLAFDASQGSKCYFPVYVPGANLSVGDLHFSQGDGELSFCGAIEMVSAPLCGHCEKQTLPAVRRLIALLVQAGIISFKCSVIKDGIKKFALKQPIFLPSPVDPMYAQQIVFEGISVGKSDQISSIWNCLTIIAADIHGDGKQYSMDATVAYKQAALNCM